MRRVFLDTNIVLDILLERGERMDVALQILSLVDQGECDIYCSSLSLATASYFLEKIKVPHDQIVKKLNIFCGYCIPTRVDAMVVRLALDSEFTDFEDALQYYSSLTENVDVIITRNKKDFAHIALPVYDSPEFVRLMESQD